MDTDIPFFRSISFCFRREKSLLHFAQRLLQGGKRLRGCGLRAFYAQFDMCPVKGVVYAGQAEYFDVGPLRFYAFHQRG